jgi:uncharacterized membrane protein
MYRFIFYRIYDWGRRAHGLGDLPEYNAILGLSMLATMNVFSIAMAVELASGRGASGDAAKYVAVALWLVFLALHFMYLLRGGRVEQIREEFEDQRSTAAANALTWAYPVVSLVLFFLLLLVRW